MAIKVVWRSYAAFADAVHAMADLMAAGVSESDISIIESDDDCRLPPEMTDDAGQPPARLGATLGAGMGGSVGALVGVGATSAPLLDSLAAFGWAAPTAGGALIGASLGAVIGLATRIGMTTRQAHAFSVGLQRGETLLRVRVDDARVAQVEAVLARIPAPHRAAAMQDPPATTRA